MTVQVKHEAEVTRQHARYAIPATLKVAVTIPQRHIREGASTIKTYKQFPVQEISVSGFSATDLPAEVGNAGSQKGQLVFDFETFILGVNVEFEVLRFDPETGALGARYTNVDKDSLALFHHLIQAYLEGVLVNVGDIIHVVSRDDFVKKDLDKRLQEPQTWREKVVQTTRRVIGVGLLAALLVGLVSFTLYTMYNRYFVVTAESARINGPITVMRSPAGGVLNLDIDTDTKQVSQGDYLGLVKLVGGGSVALESPCDCLIQIHAMDDVFIGLGEPLFTLRKKDTKLFIEAQVPIKKFKNVRVGHKAEVQFTDGQIWSGRVESVGKSHQPLIYQLPSEQSISVESMKTATVIIATDQPIPPEMLNNMVSVRIITL